MTFDMKRFLTENRITITEQHRPMYEAGLHVEEAADSVAVAVEHLHRASRYTRSPSLDKARREADALAKELMSIADGLKDAEG